MVSNTIIITLRVVFFTIFTKYSKDIFFTLHLSILVLPSNTSCHGASCMQANSAEGRKDDRLGKEKGRKDLTKADTAIYDNKGGLLPKS